jgi:predicted DNA-binding transcriptional regulator AlpA
MVKRFLPEGLAPLGLSEKEAAAFLGVSANTFSAMVQSGDMPPPRAVKGRKIWSRYEIERAFHDLPPRDAPPPDGGSPDLDRILGL